MKNTFSKDLFERYTAGTCTEEEKAMLEAWYLNQLQQSEGRPSAEQLQAAKEDIWKGIQPKRRSVPLIRWASVAAAVLVPVLFVYKLQSGKQEKEAVKKLTTVAAKKQTEGSVMYASKVGNSVMKLSDGTIVILAKGSKLTLFPTFNKKYNREVELEGKAFFDVAHNPGKPFTIYSGNVRTTVMGTAFDITAIPGSKTITVNVIRGMVEVRNTKSHWMTYLKKNMQIISGEHDEVVNRGVIDAAKELAWNKKDLEFNDISLADAKPRLEEQFGYRILIKDAELGRQAFNYSMRPNESAESFIKSICDLFRASYTIDHKNNTISIQPLNQ
jgi:transmembrane sensor